MFGSNRTHLRLSRARLLFTILIAASLLVSGCSKLSNKLETPRENQAVSTPEPQTPDTASNNDSNPLEPAPQSDLASLITILNPSKLETLSENPITFVLSQQDVPGVLWQNTFTIEGLKDQSLQDAINQDLTRLYTALDEAGLPPYRGIYQRIPPGTQPVTSNLNATSAFNFENLLSVAVYTDQSYTMGDRSEYVSRMETRNYDLHNGNNIPLPALFANPEAAMNRINDEVATMLSSQHSDEEPGFENGLYWFPRLTASFKGLEANQKYYLQPSGIVLIFDHQTPAFDTGFYPAQITLPFHLFEGELAIKERFADGPSSNLYLKSGARNQQFVQSDTFLTQQITAGEETVENNAVRAYLHFRYPNELPPAIQALAEMTLAESRNFLQTLTPNKKLSPGEEPFAEIALDITDIGPFYTLRHSVYTNCMSDGVDRHSRRPANSDVSDGVRPANSGEVIFSIRGDLPLDLTTNPSFFASYEADGRRVTLESCFAPGVDYKALLTNAYNKQATQYGYPAIQEDQIANVNFSIGHTGLECYFPDLGNYSYMGIEYKDLGSENLTIFDK